MILIGHVVREAEGGAMVYVPYPAGQRKPEGCHESVGVEFVDKRQISAKQRRKAYVLISYIAAWWGYTPAEDIPRYVWACLMNRRCAVCGRHADLHHVDVVGMGRDRKEICHIGMRALPLCREHHTEIHSIGQEDFLRRYFLEPVKIDERIADVYRLKAR